MCEPTPSGASERESALLRRIALLTDALLAMRELASVAHNGDPWYAEHKGVDAERAFALAKNALAEDS